MSRVRRRQFLIASSALLATPIVRAQSPGKKFRVGWLWVAATPVLFDPFIAAMSKLGWIEGRDFVIETRVTPGYVRSAELAKELVARDVDLIVVVATVNAIAASAATRTIPIVMYTSGYPVEVGLAESYRRPGGNVTGMSIYAGGEIWGKYVQLLREIRPGLRELGVFFDYSPPVWSEKETNFLLTEMRKAARVNGINLHLWMVPSATGFDDVISAAERSPIEALFLTSGGGVHSQTGAGARIRELVLKRRLPAMTDFAGGVFATTRCVAAYAAPISELAQRTASFVDRILRGAKPGELPIEIPTRFELVVDLGVARQIGLTIPQSVLIRADRVIE